MTKHVKKGVLLGRGMLSARGYMKVVVMRRGGEYEDSDGPRPPSITRGDLRLGAYTFYRTPDLTEVLPIKEVLSQSGGKAYLSNIHTEGYWEFIWRDY